MLFLFVPFCSSRSLAKRHDEELSDINSFIDFSTLFNMLFFHACELSHVVCLARTVFFVYTATPRSAELELTPRLKQGLP